MQMAVIVRFTEHIIYFSCRRWDAAALRAANPLANTADKNKARCFGVSVVSRFYLRVLKFEADRCVLGQRTIIVVRRSFESRSAFPVTGEHGFTTTGRWKFLRPSLYMLGFYFSNRLSYTRMYRCSKMVVVGELELSRFLFSDVRLAQNPCKNSRTKIVKVNFMETRA